MEFTRPWTITGLPSRNRAAPANALGPLAPVVARVPPPGQPLLVSDPGTGRAVLPAVPSPLALALAPVRPRFPEVARRGCGVMGVGIRDRRTLGTFLHADELLRTFLQLHRRTRFNTFDRRRSPLPPYLLSPPLQHLTSLGVTGAWMEAKWQQYPVSLGISLRRSIAPLPSSVNGGRGEPMPLRGSPPFSRSYLPFTNEVLLSPFGPSAPLRRRRYTPRCLLRHRSRFRPSLRRPRPRHPRGSAPRRHVSVAPQYDFVHVCLSSERSDGSGRGSPLSAICLRS